nr:hypothetical protein [Acidovorax sp. SUPP1855]
MGVSAGHGLFSHHGACEEPVPDRLAMPTEALRPGATVDDFARAAMAANERREGYEGQLPTALTNCRAPIKTDLRSE